MKTIINLCRPFWHKKWLFKGTVQRDFNWPFMQRWQCPFKTVPLKALSDLVWIKYQYLQFWKLIVFDYGLFIYLFIYLFIIENWALPSLHGGSLEFTLTVPLNNRPQNDPSRLRVWWSHSHNLQVTYYSVQGQRFPC